MTITREHAMVPFITSHELDRALGGGDRGRKQRGRLTTEYETLPKPRSFGRVKRQNLLILPRFAFGGLLQAPDRAAARMMIQAALDVVHNGSFGDLGLAVMESAKTKLSDRWSFASVVHGASEIAPETMRLCADLVADTEARLEHELGITFRAVFATIAGRVAGDVALRMVDGTTGRVKQRGVLVDQDAVSVFRERMDWRDSAIELVMPTSLPLTSDVLINLPSRDDLALAEWFAARSTPPAAATSVPVDDIGAPIDEYAAPRWKRKRHHAQPLHMTRVPYAA